MPIATSGIAEVRGLFFSENNLAHTTCAPLSPRPLHSLAVIVVATVLKPTGLPNACIAISLGLPKIHQTYLLVNYMQVLHTKEPSPLFFHMNKEVSK